MVTLEEMGRDYLRQSLELHEEAEKFKAQIAEASGLELLRLRRRRETIMDVCRELRITGEHLVHYYEE